MDIISKAYKEEALLARIAWMYYVQGLTHQAISDILNFSRTKVTRLLAKAKKQGIVEISINRKYRVCFELEDELSSCFSLKDIVIVPSGKDEEDSRAGVGIACARYLESFLTNGDVIGCAWGRSLFHVGNALREENDKQITVVQLMGGLSAGGNINPQRIMEVIASKLNAKGVWLNSPAVVESVEVRNALVNDEMIRGALQKGRSCSKALLGIGDVTDRASLLVARSITIGELQELRKLGAVGDILSYYYDINGKQVKSIITERIISLSLDDLKKIPLRIGITSGPGKAPAIVGALRGGYINVLFTDERTACEVMKATDESK